MKNKYTHLKVALTFVVMLASFNGFSQNVGINSTGAAPATSAGLDVDFANKGLLIPRVALASTADVTTIPSPTTSLMVYNTANAGVAPNNVTPGYYYYTGTAWTRISNGTGSGWGITGNTGTNATSNFIGTTDAQDLVVKTNNTEQMRVNSGGQVGIGSSSFTAGDDAEKLLVDAGTVYNTGINARGNINDFYQVIVQNKSGGNNASSDFVVASNVGDEYVDFGINSSGYIESKSNILNQPYTAYLYASCPQWFYIGHGVSGKGLVFFTNSGSTNANNSADGFPRMQITSAGNVGIGNFVGQNNLGQDINSYYVTEKLMVDGNITPKTTAGGNLGTTTNRWANLYANTVYNSNGVITSSDRRLKTDILPLKYGLKEILSLGAVSYTLKDAPEKGTQLGLIAQEAKKVVPEIVTGDENKEMLGVNYTEIVPVLINAIKEQQKQIDDLKKVVAEFQKIIVTKK